MRNLALFKVNDVIAEWIGPITGRNFNLFNVASPPTATVEIQLFGSGTVKLQTSTTAEFRVPGAARNPFRFDRVPPVDTGWSDVGSAITRASGFTRIPVTPDNHTCFLRILITVAGTGVVEWNSNWH